MKVVAQSVFTPRSKTMTGTPLSQAASTAGVRVAVVDGEIVVAEDAAKQLKESAPQVLDAALAALEPLEDFTAATIETALREAIVDGLGIKPRLAFGPVRTAVSGQRISPPLFESLEILGRQSTLARLTALRARLAQD